MQASKSEKCYELLDRALEVFPQEELLYFIDYGNESSITNFLENIRQVDFPQKSLLELLLLWLELARIREVQLRKSNRNLLLWFLGLSCAPWCIMLILSAILVNDILRIVGIVLVVLPLLLIPCLRSKLKHRITEQYSPSKFVQHLRPFTCLWDVDKIELDTTAIEYRDYTYALCRHEFRLVLRWEHRRILKLNILDRVPNLRE